MKALGEARDGVGETEIEVVVARGWGGTKLAIPLSALWGFHTATYAGGTGAPLPRPMLAAYMSCETIPKDYFPYFGHSCLHGPPPHRIKVLIPKSANSRAALRALHAAMSNQEQATEAQLPRVRRVAGSYVPLTRTI